MVDVVGVEANNLRRAVLAAVLNPAAQATIADALAMLDQARAALADVGLELAGVAALDRGHAAPAPLLESGSVPCPAFALAVAPVPLAPPASAAAEPEGAPPRGDSPRFKACKRACC